MKPRLLILVTLLLFSSCVFSQESQSKWSAGCSFGVHFPLGNFVSALPNDPQAGYAMYGYRLSMPVTYFIWKNYEISTLLFSQKHDIDKAKILRQLSLPSQDFLKSLPWSFEGFLAGPSASLAMDDKKVTFFNIKILGGIVNAELAQLGRYVYYNDPQLGSQYYLVTSEQASDIAFAFSIDAGIQYRMGNHLALICNANYFSSEPEFKNLPVVMKNGAFVNSTYSQPVNTLGLDLGIIYLVN